MKSVSADTASIGGLVRALRKQRRVTIEHAALKAGIHRATLQRWESGQTQPRLSELSALLLTLGATSELKRQAVTLMDAPRAQALVRVAAERIAERAGIGPMPHAGDLLRAMRLRRGLWLDDVALRLEVTSRTIRRWEGGDTWPSSEQLHRLCFVLKARQEELVALTCRSVNLASAPASGTPAALDERLARFRRSMGTPPFDLKDLELFSLQAEAWRLATDSDGGTHVLAQVYETAASFYAWRDRYSESTAAAERYFGLVPRIPSLARDRGDWLSLRLMSTIARSHSPVPVRPEQAIREFRSLVPHADGMEQQSSAMIGIGEVFGRQGLWEESVRATTEAYHMGRKVVSDEEAIWIRGALGIRLIKFGEYARGLPLLSNGAPGDWYRLVDTSLTRAEGYIGLGEKSEAESWLAQAQADIITYDFRPLQRRHDELTAQLHGEPSDTAD